MSSNGEKRMMKRSDFAQKLLNDLRVRKEQLSSSHKCLPTDNYAYSNRGFKGSRPKSTVLQDLTSGVVVSNQIVPYGKGRNMEKIDLTKALAFALENAGQATRADPSGSASIISFLHEVGKRSLGERRKSQIVMQHQHQQPSSSSPMIHVHIKEISKGAQKLNQIIKACGNGLSFRKGRYSIQCGQELMEGAIDLEQSLRLLVDIQQASEYTTNKQRKNRIRLLDENDEEEEEDAQNKKYQKIKEVANADIEMRLLALKYPEDKNNKHIKQTSSCEDTEQRSLKPQKGRIPSVVAKLMGLGEFPEDEREAKKISPENTRHRVMQSSENLVELKEQRNSTSLDIVINKETQTVNDRNHKAKSQQKDIRGKDREKNDSNSRKINKKDREMTTKNVTRRTSSPTENKHKVVTKSQPKPLHKLGFEKKLLLHSSGRAEEEKSIKKEKLQRERQHENGIVTNQSPKPLKTVEIKTKQPLTDKAKAMRKSFSHVEVAQKEKQGRIHKADMREKNNQDIFNPNVGLCKVMKRPENQKHDQFQMKSEGETCIKSSQVSDVEIVQSSNRNVEEQKREIKDDSIMLITAARVPCQAPSENRHASIVHGLMLTDEMDQQAPISKSNGNSDKGTKGDVEADLPLLEKRREHRKRETTETLSENEINLKKILVKSQLFVDTAEALFKLNIPLNVLHDDATGGSNYNQEDKNLTLDCGFEIMKRKGRFQELSVHPFVKAPISSSKINSLEQLVSQLSKEFEKLRVYGKDCHNGLHVENYVLERDVHHKDPNLNSMWDMGWNDLMFAFIEKDDVLRDIEREVFSGLLEEITRDLICI